MWTCPECGRSFANRNQTHSCGNYTALDSHFDDSDIEVREIFDVFTAAVRSVGPVTVLPEKTRIAYQVRMSFAAVMPKRRWLDGHVVLARRLEHKRFRRIDFISRRNYVHHFRLEHAAEVDDDVRAWIQEAYAVGRQDHLRS